MRLANIESKKKLLQVGRERVKLHWNRLANHIDFYTDLDYPIDRNVILGSQK